MKKLKKLIVYLITALILFVFNFPLINTVLTAFKSSAAISAYPPQWIFSPTLDNFRALFENSTTPFGQYLSNSIMIALGSSMLAMLVCIPAAYSIVRYGVGKKYFFPFVINLRAIPLIVFALPIYMLYRVLGLIDTLPGLILLDTLINIPLAILIFVSFVQDFPLSVEEAARIDGCSVWQLLRYIIFPLMRPAIITVGILSFIYTWNEFLFGMILSVKNSTPVTVGTTMFITAWGIKWGPVAAAMTISILPPLIFVFITQRYLVSGLAAGAVKG
ncbi:MAG: carbohydrate ABC transporter permease [Bacillota bacterium]